MKDLRTIVLLDSEANHTYKCIRGEAMRSAIELRNFFTEIYIRPQHSSVAHGINRRLVFNYQLYLRQPFSLACSDLKSCYNKIAHSAASLSLKR